MNINFSSIIKYLMPFFIILSMAYLLNSILYFMLPSKGIEFVEQQNIALDYRKFNVRQFLYVKVIKVVKKPPPPVVIKVVKKPPPVVIKVVKKPEYQLLVNIVLKAIYAIDETQGLIIIEDKTKKTYMLSVGENFKEYELVRIYPNYVIFFKSNKEYKLKLNNNKNLKFSITKKSKSQDDVNIMVLEDKIVIQRTYLNSYINDFNKIWNDISIIEHKNKNGHIVGFKVTNLNTQSIFEKLGLRQGDIITSVNNIELKSYNSAFSLYKKINKMKDLTMQVLRNSREVELQYEIK